MVLPTYFPQKSYLRYGRYHRIRSFGNQKRQKLESMYSKSSKLVEIVFCIDPTPPFFVPCFWRSSSYEPFFVLGPTSFCECTT